MKRNCKLLALCLLLIVSMMFLSSCLFEYIDKTSIYDKDWIIGKTLDEVQEKYGTFDAYLEYDDEIKCSVGIYKTRKIVKLDFTYYECYKIFFDENGIAYSVRERFPAI